MNESRGLSSTSRVRQGRRLVVMMMLAVIGFIHEGTCDGADFATLFQRIPTSANALVAIDVDAMFASSIGKSNDWETTYRDNYASSPLIVPPASRQFLLAADFELKTMQPRWQVGSLDLKIDRSIKEIQSIT
ncbi:MAG: hypothetical protein KDA60_05010, partial [Planctomycetales bacterium]|nr:hypothetical protein [Planctomycetales bacterium]